MAMESGWRADRVPQLVESSPQNLQVCWNADKQQGHAVVRKVVQSKMHCLVYDPVSAHS